MLTCEFCETRVPHLTPMFIKWGTRMDLCDGCRDELGAYPLGPPFQDDWSEHIVDTRTEVTDGRADGE